MIVPAPARTSYLIRGLQGPGGHAGSIRRAPARTSRILRSLRGLGQGCVASCPDYNTCSAQMVSAISPTDFNPADVAAHQAQVDAFNNWYTSDPSSPHNCTPQGTSTPTGPAPEPVYASVSNPAPAPAPTYASQQTTAVPVPTYANASVVFSPSRGGGVLYPGDTWTISIQNAHPNAQVSVAGGVNGASANTVMGTTNSSGSWSTSGTIDSTQIGSWYEAWSVGGASIGSFSFSVQATPAAPSPATPTPAPAAAPAISTPVPTVASANWFTESMIDGIPNWGLVAGAAVAVLLFAMGGKR